MGLPPLSRDMARTEAEVPEYVRDALRDQQCRAIVTYVSAADGTVSLRELADHLAAREDASGPTRTSPPSKKLLVKLHHVLLPRLDDAGLVEYAPEKRRLAYAGEWVLADPASVDDLVDEETSRVGASG